MKTYEKPKLIALSLAANDMLCSGCGEDPLRDKTDIVQMIIDLNSGVDKDGNGVIDSSEGNALFTDSNDGCTSSVEIEGYCKYTSTGVLMWS